MMAPHFADRLAEAVRSKRSALVVGLDPRLDHLPADVLAATGGSGCEEGADPRQAAAAAIRRFDAAVIDLVAPYAVAVKPQIAFYEQWGPPGLEAYEHAVLCARAAGLLVIGDIKRGDIGSTAEAYAAAHLGPRCPAPADAVTLNPWLGTDSLKPFLDAARSEGRGVFVLVRTSNPSASELQDLEAEGHPIHEHVARLVQAWGADSIGTCGYSSVGAVVGATAPRELQRLRSLMPSTWLLIPGVGAQGATAADVAAGFDSNGLGAIVNSSRGILYAFGDPRAADWKTPIRQAAQSLRDQLREAALSAAT
jgi:orotidine-5'-phosphate decarboxylase